MSHFSQQQQLQAQHLSHGHGLPVPLTPHPSGLQPPAIPPIGSSAGLLALSSALGGQSHLPIKDEKKHHDNDHQRGRTGFTGFLCFECTSYPLGWVGGIPFGELHQLSRSFQLLETAHPSCFAIFYLENSVSELVHQ